MRHAPLISISIASLLSPDFLVNLRALITPGTTLVLTDAPVNAGTRSARGFNILTD